MVALLCYIAFTPGGPSPITKARARASSEHPHLISHQKMVAKDYFVTASSHVSGHRTSCSVSSNCNSNAKANNLIDEK
jgi:hypothetical protein